MMITLWCIGYVSEGNCKHQLEIKLTFGHIISVQLAMWFMSIVCRQKAIGQKATNAGFVYHLSSFYQ